jgi:NIMA (never in mitosis gene a)-related kinase
VLQGLQAIHTKSILHRDIKSANIFLFKDGTAKLGDFNVAKIAKSGMLRTQTGTPYYASPEIWNDQPYDTKSDIWSFGCVLYELMTGTLPFRAKSMAELYNKVVKG